MKYILFIATLFASIAVFGQDSSATRNREFYATLADFSPLNIHLKYKHQVGARTYLKFGLVNMSASRSEYLPGNPAAPTTTATSISGGLELGIEFRKQLTGRLAFFHGPNLRYTYQTTTTGSTSPLLPAQNNTTAGHSAAVPYTAGLLVNLTSNLLLAAEINPAVTFTRIEATTGGTTNSSSSYGFSIDNRGGLLSLVMRF